MTRVAMIAAWLATIGTSGIAHAELHTIVVSGLGGEPQYEQRFRQQANAVSEAVKKNNNGLGRSTTLVGAQATRDAVRKAFTQTAKVAKPEDHVMVVLIGHGTFDGEEYRFNLPGPDPTGSELLAWLDALPAQQQLIVNATSASGAVFDRWKREGRVVITATKSGGEKNATRFAEHWVTALNSSEADVDKNDVVTAMEAFEYAARKVTESFKTEVALATEHARIEGDIADRFVVARLSAAGTFSEDPEMAALLTERAGFETSFEDLKARKSELPEDRYYDELEQVLVALARVQRQIDSKQVALSGASKRGGG